MNAFLSRTTCFLCGWIFRSGRHWPRQTETGPSAKMVLVNDWLDLWWICGGRRMLSDLGLNSGHFAGRTFLRNIASLSTRRPSGGFGYRPKSTWGKRVLESTCYDLTPRCVSFEFPSPTCVETTWTTACRRPLVILRFLLFFPRASAKSTSKKTSA